MKKTICKLPDEIKGTLHEVSNVEILDKRLDGKIGVVLKIDNSYYMYKFASTKVTAQSEEKEAIRYVLGHHLCNTCNFTGGGRLCPKVADLSVETCRKYHKKEIDALKVSKRIEKYDFITKGVECFNATREYFVVSACTRYQKQDPNRNRNGNLNV